MYIYIQAYIHTYIHTYIYHLLMHSYSLSLIYLSTVVALVYNPSKIARPWCGLWIWEFSYALQYLLLIFFAFI